jgi:hypothetical protein
MDVPAAHQGHYVKILIENHFSVEIHYFSIQVPLILLLFWVGAVCDVCLALAPVNLST